MCARLELQCLSPWTMVVRIQTNSKCYWGFRVDSMMTSLYSEPIPVTEITSDWRKFHFPRDSRVITCVSLNLGRKSHVELWFPYETGLRKNKFKNRHLANSEVRCKKNTRQKRAACRYFAVLGLNVRPLQLGWFVWLDFSLLFLDLQIPFKPMRCLDGCALSPSLTHRAPFLASKNLATTSYSTLWPKFYLR